MSKDIRSFFKVVSKKPGDSKTITHSAPITPNKPKKAIIIDSDDEDCVNATPEAKAQRPFVQKSKRNKHVIDSDSDDDAKRKVNKSTKKSVNSQKLKPVDINDVFNKTVKQSKVEHVPKPETSLKVDIKEKEKGKHKKKKRKTGHTEIGIHEDDDFEKTLLELDDDDLINNLDQLDKTIEEAISKDKGTGKDLSDKNYEKDDISKEHNIDEKKWNDCSDLPKDKNRVDESHIRNGSSKENSPEKKEVASTANEEVRLPKSEKKRPRKNSENNDTPNKKQKIDADTTIIDSDQEKFEKRRYSAALYQKYLHRGGPKNHGSKALPKGKPDCLKNLTFLRTGVLDSLESEEFENLIKEHGGRVVHAVSKKVNYIVVGDDAGPAKLAKAQSFQIKEISEDDLLDLILVKSGMKPKFTKSVSEDTGFGSEEHSPKKKENDHSPKKHHSGNVAKTEDSLKKEKNGNGNSSSSSKKIEKESKESHKVKKETLDSTEKLKHKTVEAHSHTEPIKKVKIEEKSTEYSKDIKCSPTKSQSEEMYLPWTEKYRPSTMKAIIGQQDSNSNMNKLKKWLENWHKNQKPETRERLPRPSPWNQYDGAYFKCALLSGSPGVGKTTTATLVAKELGYDIVEFNASDTRSKKLLHEEVSQLLHNTTIAGYASGKSKTDSKRVLLMDEVDGMAGNEDRGGIQELISLIKTTNIPIICMCNDRNHQKMRTLVTYCYDLRFGKPPLLQIRGAMMSICFKEGIQIKPDALSELIAGTGCDVRQTLNHLSMWSAANNNLSIETVQKESKSSQKDTVLGPWDVIKKVFNESENKDMSFSDRSRLFFYDYSMGPLFVQENYIHAVPNCKSEREKLIRLAKAADSLSMGDMFESKIRSTNNWSLLDSQAYFSSVFPGYYMSGTLKGVNFPGWLGKNSKKNKFNRMLGELHVHTRTCTSGSKLAMRMDYLVPLRNAIIKPLKQNGVDGVHKAVEVMKDYNLLRDDLNNLVEMCQWSGVKNPFNDIDSKVKSAFTRTYNKEAPLLPFSAQAGVSKKRTIATESDVLGEEDDGVLESDGDDNDVNADAMIKVKTKKETGKKESSKASTSKGKTTKTTKPREKKGKKT